MKERPILFNAPMVRAILEGRKTMTRRVIKQFPTTGYRWGGWILEPASEAGMATIVPDANSQYEATGQIKARCPYGQPGDRLWVRETFNGGVDGIPVAYRATAPELNGCPWRPSIFMPRTLSRIDLKMTAVRVERVQDISEEDAEDEGAEAEFETDLATFMNNKTNFDFISTYRIGFKHLWDSLNAKRGYGWDANPWVWVIEFERIERAEAVA